MYDEYSTVASAVRLRVNIVLRRWSFQLQTLSVAVLLVVVAVLVVLAEYSLVRNCPRVV